MRARGSAAYRPMVRLNQKAGGNEARWNGDPKEMPRRSGARTRNATGYVTNTWRVLRVRSLDEVMAIQGRIVSFPQEFGAPFLENLCGDGEAKGQGQPPRALFAATWPGIHEPFSETDRPGQAAAEPADARSRSVQCSSSFLTLRLMFSTSHSSCCSDESNLLKATMSSKGE
jgi:hypothetical protein